MALSTWEYIAYQQALGPKESARFYLIFGTQVGRSSHSIDLRVQGETTDISFVWSGEEIAIADDSIGFASAALETASEATLITGDATHVNRGYLYVTNKHGSNTVWFSFGLEQVSV